MMKNIRRIQLNNCLLNTKGESTMMKNIRKIGFLQAIFVLGLMSFSANSALATDAGSGKQKKVKVDKIPGAEKQKKVKMDKMPGVEKQKSAKAGKIGGLAPGRPGKAAPGMPGVMATESVTGGGSIGAAGVPKKQGLMGKFNAHRQQSQAAKTQRNAMMTPEERMMRAENKQANRQMAAGLAGGLATAGAGLMAQRSAQKHDNKMMNQQQQQMNRQRQMPQQQQQQEMNQGYADPNAEMSQY